MLCVGTVPSAHRADRSCLAPRAPACVGSSAVLQDTWGLGCLPHTFVAEQQEVPLAASGGQLPPRALSLQPLQAAGSLGPPAAMCSVSGQGSSRGAMPTAVLHPLGFGICDCPNYLLQ